MSESSRVAQVFVLGLDDHNREVLEALPDAENYRFHPLLTIEELQYGDEIPVQELLDKAKAELDAFDGTVDAVIGFWDFPVSTMVPLLCSHARTHCASLESVIKCEHKYWSRLEQQKVIDEYPAFGLVDPDGDKQPPEGLRYPMWVKPVKSFSSDLAFGVEDEDQFRDALAEISEKIGRVGEPFEVILNRLDLPPELAEAGGRACLVEETMQGQQVTLEGYVRGDEVHIFGVVDTVNRDDVPSQDRFQYPSSLPEAAAERMAEVSRRIVRQVGLDNTTFNIEFFWDSDADRIRVLEVNPRHSQSHAELFANVDGAANHRAMLELALGRDPHMPHRQGPHAMAAKWFLRRLSDGRATRVPTAEEVAAVESAVPGVTVDVIVSEGERLSELPDQDSYSYKIANIYIGGADEAELSDKFDRCAEMLTFRFE
ncbi:acetyl-CoA carboxylase biotin carboxylase subunit family protein [Pseudonocardia sp. KRD291]|uniref:ATP-grasp domain-containing protein n=1 Tax=Pseudonocardia sp. KRD291 TaxID=2792007 RepID=UPI001CF77456|nr:ATP-grasp domain-containing protein [Pseudonocardia sp. KRD291]